MKNDEFKLILPKLIIFTGFMGSGKSTLGQELAGLLDRQFLDIDKLIEEETGLSISDIFHKYGEGYFRELESRIWERIVQEQEKPVIISTGGGTLTFEKNWNVLNNKDAVTVYLDEKFEVLWERIKSDPERPLVSLNKFSEDEVREKLMQLFQVRKKWYEKADVKINPSESSQMELIVQKIFEQLREEKNKGKK